MRIYAESPVTSLDPFVFTPGHPGDGPIRYLDSNGESAVTGLDDDTKKKPFPWWLLAVAAYISMQ